ncbi:MAG: PHP domain-containing protein [Halioglobus sp.]|nr:PHP domain-containing protein [Halioglobus sp.]
MTRFRAAIPSVKTVLVDFHTHTSASDGALAPGELLARAVASKVELLAITDHDTVAGFQAAAAYHTKHLSSMSLISGVELSCQWLGVTIHILGLGIDCEHPVMRAGLTRMAAGRKERGNKIASRLESLGFNGALQGALRQAGDSQLGRPHFAAWMVEQGHVRDHNLAFERYLGQGKIGDVKAFWPELAEVTQWIESSGGVALIAHPLKYRFTGMKLRRLIIAFMAAGGRGIEVLSGRQTSDQTNRLLRLARDFDLEISIGSDFHRDAPYSASLGLESAPFGDLRGVWQRWSNVPQTSLKR